MNSLKLAKANLVVCVLSWAAEIVCFTVPISIKGLSLNDDITLEMNIGITALLIILLSGIVAAVVFSKSRKEPDLIRRKKIRRFSMIVITAAIPALLLFLFMFVLMPIAFSPNG